MKKVFKILLIGLAILAVILVAGIIVLLQPSVQTWAARKAVANQPGMEITIGKVDAGLNKIELTGIHIKRDGMVVDLPSALVEMPLLSAVTQKINIKKLVAKGWTVDLSAMNTATPQPKSPSEAAKSKSSELFKGVFDMLKLPVDLTLDDADIQGLVILPPEAPGQQPARANVALRGGKLAPGSDGKFELTADAAMPDADALVSNIKVLGDLVVRMDTPRTVQSLMCDIDASAAGKQLPEGAKLRAHIAASQNTSGEDYALSLKSLVTGTEKELLTVKASNPVGPAGLNAMWLIDLRDSDIAPFVLGLGIKLPALTASGQGTLSADDRFDNMHAAGKLTADVSNLEVIQKELSALGRIHFASNFDITRKGDLVNVATLTADVASAQPVATIKTLQLIEVNTASGALKVPNLDADLVSIDLHGLPLAWAQPFIKDTGFVVTGEPLRGSFAGKARDGGFTLRSASPLTVGNLSVTQGKQPFVQNVDVSTSFDAAYNPAGWNANISNLSLQSHGATLLSIIAKAAAPAAVAGKPAPAISATGKVHANLPALLAQPAAADFRVLTGGNADVDFTARIEDATKQVSAKIVVADLQANDKKALPKITSDARVDLHQDGRIEAQAPLVFELNTRKSDLDLTASVKPDGARQNIDASVTSNEIYVEDLMTLSALAPTSTTPATSTQPTTTPSSTPDTKAPWDAITGQVKFALKKVIYSPDMQAGNVTGSVKITPSLLSLESLHAATTDGGEVKLDGSLKFDTATAATPYNTNAKLVVTNFDPAPFLAAANPGKKPTVEGKFDITGALTGTSATLDKVASTAAADLTLTSRGGKFNGFANSALGANLGQITKLADTQVGSAVIGGILSLVGKGDNTASIEKAKAIKSTINRLIEVDFDQMSIDAAYHPGKETVIKNFSILSPGMRLTSSGSIENNNALSWAKQAIKLVAEMSVRGDQANDMRALGLLKKDADALGFTPLMENFPIEGTVSSFATDALVKQITSRLTIK